MKHESYIDKMKTLHHQTANHGGGCAPGVYIPADLYYISLEVDGVFLGSSMEIDATVNDFVPVTDGGNENDYFDLTF